MIELLFEIEEVRDDYECILKGYLDDLSVRELVERVCDEFGLKCTTYYVPGYGNTAEVSDVRLNSFVTEFRDEANFGELNDQDSILDMEEDMEEDELKDFEEPAVVDFSFDQLHERGEVVDQTYDSVYWQIMGLILSKLEYMDFETFQKWHSSRWLSKVLANVKTQFDGDNCLELQMKDRIFEIAIDGQFDLTDGEKVERIVKKYLLSDSKRFDSFMRFLQDST